MVEDSHLSGRRSHHHHQQQQQIQNNRSASVVSSSDTDATCFTCCCSPCIGLCYLFCLRSMKVSTRLKIIWIWMISLSIGGGLFLKYNMYSSDSVSITSFDMMPVRRMSTFFCQGVVIDTGTMRTPLAVYRLNTKPHLNTTLTVFNMSHKFTLFFIQEKMANFYLLKGSEVSLKICARYSFTVFIIKGTNNWKKFKKTQGYEEKTWKFTNKCSTKKYRVTYTDRYYFVLNNQYTHIMELQLALHKTTFQLNRNESKLLSEKWHTFVPLEFNSDESILYQPTLETYQELNVTTQCHPLVLIYVGIFFGGALSIGLILCYFVKCVCKDPPSEPPPLSTAAPQNTSPYNPSLAGPMPSLQIHPTAPPHPDNVFWPHRAPQLPTGPPPSYDSLFANSANTDPPPYMRTTIELDRK